MGRDRRRAAAEPAGPLVRLGLLDHGAGLKGKPKVALITDTLRTVLEVQGLSAYLTNLRQVQQGSVQAGLATGQLQQNLTGLPRLLNNVSQSLGAALPNWTLTAVGIYGAVSAVRQLSVAMEAAMTTFDRYKRCPHPSDSPLRQRGAR